MDNNIVMVKSASDYTVVVNVPDLTLHRTWTKRGQQFPIDRKVLFQAYYDPSVEFLFNEGLLTTDDEEFLKAIGLMEENGEKTVIPLTETFLNRMIKLMPLSEVKAELEKLTRTQLDELADYAILHYKDLHFDRIDILTKATGKDIMGAIKNYKDSEEG